MIRLAILLTLIALPMPAPAQGRTVYGSDGKAVAPSTTDTQGTVTTYGADGKVVSREANTGNGTTVYDGSSGRVIARTTREKR